MRRHVERAVEKKKTNIDYRKAFETVKYKSWVELQQSLDIGSAGTRLLTNLY